MIAILMSTYNGAKYIREQLQSIVDQTIVEWKLYIRDDCSTDETTDIIREFMAKDDRIMLTIGSRNLRSCQSFHVLSAEHVDAAPYFMYCDQDDIWFPNKIDETLKQMLKIEGSHQYCLVYSTQKLVDGDGCELHRPYPDYSRKNFDIKHILLENPVYGCTMMVNQALLKKSMPIANSAENHDYWIVLNAISLGAAISYIDKALMYYRQHESNVSGNVHRSSFFGRMNRLIKSDKDLQYFTQRNIMFSDFLIHSKDWISKQNKILIQDYVNHTNKGGIRSILYLWKNSFRKEKLIQTLYFYTLILLK
ncbi:glycosyltransferase family 2 protein [Sphingobacterium paludis]|uniref:Rhamnosyltransferase n=1 Tax=Sphingobacterium paludis TaxID=1476465 RepID=A0A4V3E1K4_9SPHI|nr:glycosyltransferase family 2 protein [Sphingobacterium paludis]TDS13698.1 rhamnosyltransferase [Sphingobacterium paludis]